MTGVSEVSKKTIDVDHNCFDIIRCICTFTVFLGHFITHFNVPTDSILYDIAYFVRGVPVFFLLSGIFIARSLERYDTKDFILKRIFRIYPELWICILLNLAIILLTYDGGFSAKDILIYLTTQLTFCQFYTGGWLRGYGVGVPNGALWTITVDIQFYILAILIAKLMRNRSMKSWLILIASGALFSVIINHFSAFFPSTAWSLMQCIILPFFYIFFAGMAIWYQRDKIIPILVRLKWILLVAYIIWMLFVPSSVVELFSGVRYNVVTTLLLICVVVAFGFSYKYRFKIDYSYSFYLYHMVVLNFIYQNILTEFSSASSFVLTFLAAFLTTAVFGFCSKQLIDMRLGTSLERKFSRQKAK